MKKLLILLNFSLIWICSFDQVHANPIYRSIPIQNYVYVDYRGIRFMAFYGSMFSFDETKIIGWGSNGIWVWDAAKANVVSKRLETVMIKLMDLSPDGKKMLAANSASLKISILNALPPYNHITTLTTPINLCTCTFTTDSQHVLGIRGDDKGVITWNLADGKMTSRTFNFDYSPSDTYSPAIFSPDCSGVLACPWDGGVHYFSLNTGKELRQFRTQQYINGSGSELLCFALSADGKKLLTAPMQTDHSDGKVCLWDVKTGVLLHLFSNHPGDLFSYVAFTPDSKWVLAATQNEGINEKALIWDQATGNLILSLPNTGGPAFTKNGLRLLLGLTLWRTDLQNNVPASIFNLYQ